MRTPGRGELSYLLRAARWELVAVGALPGLASAVYVHLRTGSMALAAALGVTGIAVGAAFVLDDPAATTIESVPATLRRRTTQRALLAAVAATSAFGYLAAAVWTPLRFEDVAIELAGLVALALAAGVVGARTGGPTLAGIVGAAAVTGVLLLDQLILTRRVLVSGGSGSTSTAWWLAGALAATLVFLLATRDPVAGRPERR